MWDRSSSITVWKEIAMKQLTFRSDQDVFHFFLSFYFCMKDAAVREILTEESGCLHKYFIAGIGWGFVCMGLPSLTDPLSVLQMIHEWMQRNSGMTLTAEKWRTRRETCLSVTLPNINPTGTDWAWTRACAVKCRRLIACALLHGPTLVVAVCWYVVQCLEYFTKRGEFSSYKCDLVCSV
jgi:hypothetical protein